MRVIEGENELLLTCSRSVSGGIAHFAVRDARRYRAPAGRDRRCAGYRGRAYALSERAPDLTGKDTFAVRITCGGRSRSTMRRHPLGYAPEADAKCGQLCIL